MMIMYLYLVEKNFFVLLLPTSCWSVLLTLNISLVTGKNNHTTLLPSYLILAYWVFNTSFLIISFFHFVLKIGTEPSDNQYLVVDIGLGALPSLMIGNCGPHKTLVKRKPPRHLLSFLPLFSIISFLFFQTCAYVIMWYYVQTQPW